jgi:hypothetical protein
MSSLGPNSSTHRPPPRTTTGAELQLPYLLSGFSVLCVRKAVVLPSFAGEGGGANELTGSKASRDDIKCMAGFFTSTFYTVPLAVALRYIDLMLDHGCRTAVKSLFRYTTLHFCFCITSSDFVRPANYGTFRHNCV